MGSLQVCPVCKEFSSSSNTTLNAHIDNCLSVGPSTKRQTSSKAVKHQTKPRRTRLIVDIYKTSRRSTLVDLDQRNGTNWTSFLTFTADDNDKVHSSVVDKDAISDRSGVFIESNDMELRILSQLSNTSHSSDESNVLVGRKRKYLDEQQSGSQEQEDDESDDLVFVAKRVGSKRFVQRMVSMGDHETTSSMEQGIYRNDFSFMGTEMVHKEVSCDKGVSSVTNPKASKLRKKRLVRMNTENSIVAVKVSNAQHAANDDKLCCLGEVERSYQFASEYISKLAGDEASAFKEEYQGFHQEIDDYYLEDHKNSYADMASIIIPGPPGCDLPSPGLEGSDELYPNSSFTTHWIQFSDDEHMDSSDSAKSAVLSPPHNHAVDGNNLMNMPMMLSHVQSANQVVFLETRVSSPQQVAGAGQERSAHELSNLQYFNASHWYQSSEPREQQLLPLSSGYKPPNQLTTNPILRLMGKNLMVVNKDDDHPNTILPTRIQNAHHKSSDGLPIPFVDGLGSGLNGYECANRSSMIHG